MPPTRRTFRTTPVIALFNTSVAADFTLANRLDAVGSTTEANTLYKEGAGYPALTPFSIDYAFTRRLPGGCTGSSGGACNSVPLIQTTPGPLSNPVQDTNNNATDFIFVDTNGTSAGAGQRLGAPGPENTTSPIASDDFALTASTLDSCRLPNASPNYVRAGGAYCGPPNDIVAPCVPAQNSTFGTLDIRQTFTNDTGADITRLRFRVVDITTFPSISGVADLRPITSSDVAVTVDRPVCGTGTSSVTVRGTTLEVPPESAERIRVQRVAVGRRDHGRNAVGAGAIRQRALRARRPADGRRPLLCRGRNGRRAGGNRAGFLFHRSH